MNKPLILKNIYIIRKLETAQIKIISGESVNELNFWKYVHKC